MRWQPPLERFLPKVAKADVGCWDWLAGRQSDGYGTFHDGKKPWLAHRYAYELWVGPIPEGMELDHLCESPGCVAPHHLEVVTHQENLKRAGGSRHNARKKVCSNGHLFDGVRDGRRKCSICQKQWNRDSYLRRLARKGGEGHGNQ